MMKRPVALLAPLAAFVVVAAASAVPPRERLGVLWRDPGAIASKDLHWGACSADGAPKAPFKFLKKDGQGTRPKALARDAAGTIWQVKFRGAPDSNEVHAEIAATRLLWALGYFVEELYFVPSGRLEGGSGDDPEYAMGADGTFHAARFEKRSPDLEFVDDVKWSFGSNPFYTGREMSGLKILLTMINDWDNGGSRNTMVLRTRRPDGVVEDRYMMADLGASFGWMGPLLQHRTRWNLADYQRQPFIDDVDDGEIDLHYKGEGDIDKIPLDHARWFASLVGQLSAAQVRAAFEASGATPEEIDGFSRRFIEKIAELQRAVTTGETAARRD